MAERWLRSNRQATLEVITPLHVGSGAAPLVPDYDAAFEPGVAWVMDQRLVLETFDDEQLRHGVPEVRLSRILGPGRYAACAAYSLPTPGIVAREILPTIKDVEGRPYLPGSSIKGALRSAIAWFASKGPVGAPASFELGGNPKYAASQWERKVFGRSPNYDLMRALLVDDSGPTPLDRLELAVVSTYSLRGAELASKGPGYQFYCEALRAGTVLSCRVGLAEDTLSQPALGLREKRGWLDGLAAVCRDRAAELIGGERDFYAGCQLRPLQQFYDRLESLAGDLAENQFLLQMSWGTGWSAKTLGASLAADGRLEEVRERYRLGRRDAPFPKSRRLVERGGVAAEPLGWVKVTL